ncbi:MAG: rane protein [Actinomycetota bacterium]|jgi:membrane protein|nr:rane protein [Actinomycetota bacterium]
MPGGSNRNNGGSKSPLETALAPIASLVVLGTAMAETVLDRDDKDDKDEQHAGDPTAERRPPGAAIEEEKHKEDAAHPGGLRARLDKLGERIPLVGRALEVQQRYGELRGNNVAAAVAFQAFVSLFPLLLVIVGVLGIVARNSHVDVAGRIIANLGLTGDAATTIRNAVNTAKDSGALAGPLGLVGLLWSGLGLVSALQYALNQAWQVEERGIKDKAVGLAWLVGAVVLFVGASVVTTVINWLPGYAAPLGIAAGLLVNFTLWLWTFKVLPNRDLPWRAHVPGAILGAVGMEVLKVVGGIYVPRAVAHSSALYGTLGVVFAVLAWLLFFGRLIVYAAVLDVVLWEREAGTVTATVEVPAGGAIDPGDDVTRSGRVERADLRS